MSDDPYEPGILGDIQRAYDMVRFHDIVREESKRTIMCRPDQATRLRWHVDQAGLDDVITVVESPYVPDGQVLVIADQTIEAANREALSKMRFF